MSRVDEHDIIGSRPAASLGPLFGAIETKPTHTPPHQRQHVPAAGGSRALLGEPTGPGAGEFLKPRLLPHLLEFAETRVHHHPPGFTADDVRELAIRTHLITGHERGQRVHSWIGPWLASLARKGTIAPLLYTYGQQVRRRSTRDQAHGNEHLVYTAASDRSRIAA